MLKSKLFELGIGDTVIWNGEDTEITEIKGHHLKVKVVLNPFDDVLVYGRSFWIDERELHF